jgi:hypothetical protein
VKRSRTREGLAALHSFRCTGQADADSPGGDRDEPPTDEEWLNHVESAYRTGAPLRKTKNAGDVPTALGAALGQDSGLSGRQTASITAR